MKSDREIKEAVRNMADFLFMKGGLSWSWGGIGIVREKDLVPSKAETS